MRKLGVPSLSELVLYAVRNHRTGPGCSPHPQQSTEEHENPAQRVGL